MSPRHVPASVTELSRVGLFGSLPGEVLGRLAEELAREEVPPGGRIEDGFVVVLSGLLRGREVLRPGTWALDAGPLGAVTPAVVAHCSRETYERLIALKAPSGRSRWTLAGPTRPVRSILTGATAVPAPRRRGTPRPVPGGPRARLIALKAPS